MTLPERAQGHRIAQTATRRLRRDAVRAGGRAGQRHYGRTTVGKIAR